jgi:hypothetical protein
MSDPFTDHPSRRLTVTLPHSYDSAVAEYERLVPEFPAAAFAACATWQDHLDLVATAAPHHFMRYHQMAMPPLMSVSGATWQATQYLMGNHTIAARMFRHDPAVMLHAPLRTLLYEDRDGSTVFAVDQPSLLFDSYGSDEISAVGRELDGDVAALFALLGADVPGELGDQTRM